ncbi:hypothetical protein NE237_017215 [Protea cynaroides]|uniref:DUF4283 domain-containing protein n=1 Tax=Protea cynaroides TaxID=273540 RepID=A0A9Q0K7L9_9MAGN|nr:hypothetical protein NE237_017215 [Protea cynaroides]
MPKVNMHFVQPAFKDSKKLGICSKDAVAQEIEELHNPVMDFFMGQRPSFGYVRHFLSKQWQRFLTGSMEVFLLTNGGFAFEFSNSDDRDKVVEKGRFLVGGKSIFIRRWVRNLHSGSLGLKNMPIWVSFPELPLHLWGIESLNAICSVLRKPVYADHMTSLKSRKAFARRVSANPEFNPKPADNSKEKVCSKDHDMADHQSKGEVVFTQEGIHDGGNIAGATPADAGEAQPIPDEGISKRRCRLVKKTFNQFDVLGSESTGNQAGEPVVTLDPSTGLEPLAFPPTTVQDLGDAAIFLPPQATLLDAQNSDSEAIQSGCDDRTEDPFLSPLATYYQSIRSLVSPALGMGQAEIP